jgi:ferredoxin
MRTAIINGEKLWDWVTELARRYEVIAPKDELSYGVITSAKEIQFSANKPRRSLKEFFLAPHCSLFSYRSDGSGVSLTTPELDRDRPRVLFGAHPCDVAALAILDRVFMWDSIDPFYVLQRQLTTIIALACDEPCAAGFCTSVGGSPGGTEGADLVLSSLGESHYHVQAIGGRGAALLDEYSEFFAPSNAELDAEVTHAAEQQREQLPAVAAEALANAPAFDSPVWQGIAQQCVDCGVCTFLCPTCHCFDIQDEGSATEGARVRLWDSCAFRSFTKTMVGEPRATHSSRYRQRVLHKFRYYPQNFGRILCVGCGRCVEHCPAGIDIRQVLQAVRAEV